MRGYIWTLIPRTEPVA